MTKKTLLSWYKNDINYNERERLHEIGVSDYDYHYLQDLRQILLCEDIANGLSEIKSKLSGKRIRKIIFFTPFNDSKPDSSYYSCAIVTDGNNNNWVIIYRPSWVSDIQDDILIKKVDISASEAEGKLNGDYPIVAVAPSEGIESLSPSFLITEPFVRISALPFDARNNPDEYILPLDIVKRKGDMWYHYAIYLGNKWIVHLPAGGEPTKFDTWHKFCNPSSSSSSSLFFPWNSSSSSSSGLGSEKIISYHPVIPFKRKDDIIRHIAKAVSYEYGKYSYNFATNNCEHLVKRCIFSIDSSYQVERHAGSANPMSVTAIANMALPLEWKMENQSSSLDKLTSSYSYEKGRIEQHIREAENNCSYTCIKQWMEQKKFQERIEVYPKDWCRVQ